ncbi:MAG: HAMP domain-containing histidine kinase [Clostridia bacterium]|nr:HAMP domain-containing histidine kinase [Clostridia bacterium]NCC42068.1 HAMP domain-containing histidine kinase [Clostridia bacterium]
MKLKNRIIISFFVVILVPLVLTSIALMGFTSYQLRSIEKQYGVDGITYESLSNNTLMLSKMTQKIFEGIQKTVQENPANMEDKAYLDSVNKELKAKNAYLLVRKEQELAYSGSTEDVSVLFEELPEYGDSMAGTDKGIYIGADVQSLVKQVDFIFPEHMEGSAFIIIQADTIIPQMQQLLADMVFVIVLILIVTALGLCTWTYRGVITPLNQLKEATKNIKEGNLDFTVERSGVDEISDLCEDFEDMRQRLKQSAEEKVNFDKENKELISNISHDLKTPITAVKGYVEGIMDGVADTPEKMDKYIRTIYTKANEMDRLINELTFYSKIDTNRIPYTFNKINISDYFEDCVDELNVELESSGVSLTYFNYLEDPAVVIADAEQIKRVINNIISNSLKYMNKPKGAINIRLRDVGDFIQIEIEDNGKGISQKDLANVFDRFYRTDASRNSSKGGSGIGLSIVKKIMEDHGGQVWATSKEGTGTTMYLALRKYQEVPANE